MLRGNSFWRLAALVLTATALGPAPASAGWLSLRNDTRTTLIVQEIVIINGQPRRGTQRQLYPGEVAVESVAGAGVKRLLVFEPKMPTVPLLRTERNYTGADQVFSIQLEAGPTPGAPPRCKLVPVAGSPATMRGPPRRP
jgi:hypothetical protein